MAADTRRPVTGKPGDGQTPNLYGWRREQFGRGGRRRRGRGRSRFRRPVRPPQIPVAGPVGAGVRGRPEIGGTWYFNRYPGARCDVESVDYCYSFSEELQQEWTWTEVRHAGRDPALHELGRRQAGPARRHHVQHQGHLGDPRRAVPALDRRHRHRRDGDGAVRGDGHRAAVGGADPAFPGLDTFAGEVYHTAHWPHEPVDFTGKRVAVIGTGSSGIQSIPLIAEQAEHLYVFQRTPNFSVPAGNRPLTAEEVAEIKANYAERRRLSWRSGGGSPHIAHPKLTMEVSAEERRAAFERRWDLGGVLFSKTFSDQMIDEAANEEARKFYEEKVRAVIDDPALADLLIPNDHPIGTKRICTDTNYFQTFNRSNVTLVSVRNTPIESIDPTGITTSEAHYDIDALVLATGFDAMTGALDKIDIVGRDGRRLREDWADGPRTYLGLGVDGFPNLFLVSGPEPAVLANMVLHAEAHIDWIADAIGFLDDHGYAALEATPSRSTTGSPNAIGAPKPLCSRGRTPGTWVRTSLGNRGFSCCSSAGSPPTWTSAPRWPRPATRVSS